MCIVCVCENRFGLNLEKAHAGRRTGAGRKKQKAKRGKNDRRQPARSFHQTRRWPDAFTAAASTTQVACKSAFAVYRYASAGRPAKQTGSQVQQALLVNKQAHNKQASESRATPSCSGVTPDEFTNRNQRTKSSNRAWVVGSAARARRRRRSTCTSSRAGCWSWATYSRPTPGCTTRCARIATCACSSSCRSDAATTAARCVLAQAECGCLHWI